MMNTESRVTNIRGLSKKGRMKEGEITWESISWFTSLEHTVNHLGQLMARTSDSKTLAGALKEIEKIATKLGFCYQKS